VHLVGFIIRKFIYECNPLRGQNKGWASRSDSWNARLLDILICHGNYWKYCARKLNVSTGEGIFSKIFAIWVRALKMFANTAVYRKNLSNISSKESKPGSEAVL